jgi:hypothetical protein
VVRLHIVLKIIAILAVEALVRLELGHYGFSVAKLFWLLMTTTLVGNVCGLETFISIAYAAPGSGITD